jgi:hypothetical protein
MTNKELNAAIKKFAKQIKDGKIDPEAEQAKQEFTRLHGADRTMQALNADSLRILFVLNRRYNYTGWHYFGPDDLPANL